MARLMFSILARQTSIDRDTNVLHIFNVVENVSVTGETPERGSDGVAYLPIDCVLIMLWAREDFEIPETDTVRVVVYTPDGQEFSNPEQMVDLSEYRRMRIRGEFEAIPFTRSGEYRVSVQRNQAEFDGDAEWINLAEYPVEINFSEIEQG